MWGWIEGNQNASVGKVHWKNKGLFIKYIIACVYWSAQNGLVIVRFYFQYIQVILLNAHVVVDTKATLIKRPTYTAKFLFYQSPTRHWETTQWLDSDCLVTVGNCQQHWLSCQWLSGRIMLFRTEERKSSSLGNVYMPHRIVEYTQTIDLMCKSANLVSLPRGDRIKL